MTGIRRSTRFPRALRFFLAVVTVSLSAAMAGCDAERSSNPLSPSIAGPLAGVTITSPSAIGAANTPLIPSTEQPVTLTFAGAQSNSVRPFTYELQVATDPAFTQIVVELTGIEPNALAQVAITLPRALEPDRVYYWRVRALDGANTGEYSAPASFEVFTPVVVGAPKVGSPADGSTTVSNSVTLQVVNPEITGPAKSILYRFELATDPSFAAPSAVLTVGPTGGTTTSASPGALPFEATFFWRVRASADGRNGKTIGAWTGTASFTTPTPPVVIGTPTPTSPVGGATVPTLRPTLVVANGEVTGDAGTVTYQFQLDDGTGFTSPESTFSVTRSGAGTTSGIVTVDLAAATQYYWRVRATTGALTSSWSAIATFLTAITTPPGPAPGGGPAAPPLPNPGGQLPLPNMFGLVSQLAAQHPGLLAKSCQDHGGTWEFMDLVVDRLRQVDGRWGFNCKRGNCPDISQDVVDYHYGTGSASGSTEVYIIDIIGGHCGPDPGPVWIDQTGKGLGRWIFPR
ncbi:MAG: hypothetical protein O3A25_01050 [Acidobacteria bacterium]|nr:hypothetical protein [Acidobacteriota bacterium]